MPHNEYPYTGKYEAQKEAVWKTAPRIDVLALVTKMGLLIQNDGVDEFITEVLNTYSAKVEEYKAGKTNLLELFIGQVMKLSRGKAEPKALRAKILERLQ